MSLSRLQGLQEKKQIETQSLLLPSFLFQSVLDLFVFFYIHSVFSSRAYTLCVYILGLQESQESILGTVLTDN